MGGPQSGTLSYTKGILQVDPGHNFLMGRYKEGGGGAQWRGEEMCGEAWSARREGSVGNG